MVNSATASPLGRHYRLLSVLRICLSDREALGYLSIGIVVALLFGMTILIMTLGGEADAGHIYSVMTYMWMFAMSSMMLRSCWKSILSSKILVNE